MNKEKIIHTEVLRGLRYIDILNILNNSQNDFDEITTLLYAEIYEEEETQKHYVKIECQFDIVCLDEDGDSYLLHDAIYSNRYEFDGNYKEILIVALEEIQENLVEQLREGKKIHMNLINDEINWISNMIKMGHNIKEDE